MLLLTLLLCLTTPANHQEIHHNSHSCDHHAVGYNIYEYIEGLQLQICSLVAVGLKYFAIFVENGIVNANGTNVTEKYFLGLCHKSTLERWTFCSPSLTKKRKNKCKFKLNPRRFKGRVHRRFCDVKLMVKNKDCQCEATHFGDEMHKVQGFPTCYIPPLPESLCKYNVCGLSKCRAFSVEERVHSVQCEPKCPGGRPFCEHPLKKSSTSPILRSSWSRWRRAKHTHSSPDHIRRKRWISTCINQETHRKDIDCLGPGTACCRKEARNCSCDTYERDGALVAEKIVDYPRRKSKEHKRPQRSPPSTPTNQNSRNQDPEAQPSSHSEPNPNYHYIRAAEEATEDDDDDDDDPDQDHDVYEDVILEEDLMKECNATCTTNAPEEDMEKDEMKTAMTQKLIKESKSGSLNKTVNATILNKSKQHLLSLNLWTMHALLVAVNLC